MQIRISVQYMKKNKGLFLNKNIPRLSMGFLSELLRQDTLKWQDFLQSRTSRKEGIPYLPLEKLFQPKLHLMKFVQALSWEHNY